MPISANLGKISAPLIKTHPGLLCDEGMGLGKKRGGLALDSSAPPTRPSRAPEAPKHIRREIFGTLCICYPYFLCEGLDDYTVFLFVGSLFAKLGCSTQGPLLRMRGRTTSCKIVAFFLKSWLAHVGSGDYGIVQRIVALRLRHRHSRLCPMRGGVVRLRKESQRCPRLLTVALLSQWHFLLTDASARTSSRAHIGNARRGNRLHGTLV